MTSHFVAVVGIVFGVSIPFSIPILYIVLSYRRRQRLLQLHHIERMAAIERGMELPPLPVELIDGAQRDRHSSLLPGLIWLFVGLALLIAMRSLDERGLVGLIPTGIGIAYLIYYVAEGRRREARLLERQLADQREYERAAGAKV